MMIIPLGAGERVGRSPVSRSALCQCFAFEVSVIARYPEAPSKMLSCLFSDSHQAEVLVISDWEEGCSPRVH